MTGAGAVLSEGELLAVSTFLSSSGVELAGPLTAELISGGRSNVTVRLHDGADRWVLRMPPRVGRTPSAHDVAREYRVTAALARTGVPVPPPVALCEDDSIIGCPFAIAEFVPGRTIQTRHELDHLADNTVESVMVRLIEVLATLHGVDHEAVGLTSFGRPDGYAERQIRRWSSQWALVAPDDEGVRKDAAELMVRLTSVTPGQRSVGIVHGDFRIDNTLLLLKDSAEPNVSAVVDWELSTIGDPVADVAMMCAYRHPAFDRIVGVASAWTSDRLPGIAELALAYEAAGGAPLVSWDFHLALAYFKVAVIAAGIDHRYRVGAASGVGFDSARSAVAPYLAAGLDAL